MASEAQKNTLQQLYIAYYGRPAEPSGLEFWEDQIDTQGKSLDDIANEFTSADEFVAAYGDDTAALVRAAYENALGRGVESEEALNFWVGQLDSGDLSPADLMNEFFGTSDVNDRAVLENRTEVANALTIALGKGYDAAAAAELLKSVTSDRASVDAALVEIGAEVPADTSELTEQLEALANAREDMQLAEDELVELLVEAGIIANAAAFDIDELENYKLDAQAQVDELNAELSSARAQNFSAYDAAYNDADLTTKDGAGINAVDVTALLTDLEVSGRMTDANVANLVTKAKAAVKADEAIYDVEGTTVVDADGDLNAVSFNAVYFEGGSTYAVDTDGTYAGTGSLVGYVPTATTAVANKAAFDAAKVATFSASALESRVIAADAALANHVATQGEQAELLANIAEVAAAYVAQNTSAEASAYVAAYAAALEAVNGDASQVVLVDVQTELNALIDAAFDGDLTTGDLDVTEVELADNARGNALAEALAVQAKRYELEDAADDAEDAFMAVEAGENQRIAEALQAERDALIQDRDDAVEASGDLNDLIEAYETAAADFAQIAEDLGYEVQDLDAAFEFATDEADLFVFNLSSFTNDDGDLTQDAVTVNDLEAGDALFFGGYELSEGTGDNNALEFFLEQVGTNTVVTVESTAFGGAAGEGNIEVTLTGISVDQLNIENGLISIVEIA